MAITIRTTSSSAQRAQQMRETWQKASQHGKNYLAPVGALLASHPPLVQGVYYVLMGLWPLVSLDTLVKVAGPRTDWLQQSLGALVLVIGATLLVAAYRKQNTPEVFCLALGCAGIFAGLDLYFIVSGQVSPIYLVDVVIELGLLALWLSVWRQGEGSWQHRPEAGPHPPGPGAAA